MNFCPGLDQALLRPWEPAADALDRVEREGGHGVLVQGVEVRPMVGRAKFREHPNDDSEEARQFRHGGTLHRQSGFRRANALPLSRERRLRFFRISSLVVRRSSAAAAG